MSLWRFVGCFSLICCVVSGQDTIYKLVGGGVDFPGFSNKESPTDILWKRVEGHNVHKVVHFDGREEKSFGSFEDRVTLDWHSANLFISDLRYEDSGFYDLEILINNQHMTKRYKLIVIDKVTKPTISCEINSASTSESAGKATLLCSLPTHSDQSSLEFQWSTNGQINRGHMLKISLGGEVDDHQYNCTVKNQLTEESAVFTAKDCYPEPKAQAGLIAGVVVLVVLLLIILLLFFICLKKVRSKKSDLESHSKPGYLNVAASGSEETRVLLDRAPTFPSKQTLEHLKQINDAPLNPPHKGQNRISRKSDLRSHYSENKVQDNKSPSPALVKKRCMFFEEIGKANEAEPRKVVEEEVLANNPSDPEAMNPELTDLSSERSLSEKPEGSGFSSPPAVSPNLNHPCSDDEKSGDEEKPPDVLENNPVEAEETKDALTGALNGNNGYKKATENTNPEDKRPVSNDPSDSGNPDEVPENQNIWNKENNPVDAEETKDALTGALNGNNGYKKATENTNPEDKRPVSNDPSDSGNPDEVPENQNIWNKENNPVEAEETKDALTGALNGNNGYKKATENTNPEDKRPVSNDPSDSGNPDEVPENQNSENKVQDNKSPSPALVKERCMFFEKENGKANEAEPRKVVQEEVLENNPSDSEAMNPELTALSSERNILNKEDNPVEAEETKDALTGALNGNNGYKKATENTNPEDKRPVSNDPSDSGNPDEVPENQNSEKPYDLPVKQRCKIFEKEIGKANEAEPREVVEEEVLANNPSDSVAMNPELTALSSESNSGRKKEENEFEKSTPENDVQPPPVAKESSPLSQNSPESAPEAERKQDINPDECAKKSNGESSSSSSEESENEEQAPPASTAKETDSETTVEEQKPL